MIHCQINNMRVRIKFYKAKPNIILVKHKTNIKTQR